MRIVPGRNFRLLVSAGTVSQFGDWAAKIALSVLVYQQTGSASAVGFVNAVMILPWLGPGQWLASRCDRFDRRRLLIACDGVRGAIFLIIALGHLPLAPLLVLVALTATLDSVFEVNRAALLADVVARDDYADAIRLNHVLDQGSQLLGYAGGGMLAAALGPGNALVVNGVTFLVSAALLGLVSRASTSEREVVKPSLAAAASYLLGDRISLLAVALTVVVLFGAASIEYQAVIYGEVVVGLGRFHAGLLAAAVPAGSVVVLAVMRTGGDDLALLRRGAGIGALASVGSALLLGGSHLMVGSFVGFGLVGAVLVVSSLSNMVVGRRIPAEIRGSTFAVLQAVVFAAGSAGMAAGGLLSDALSPRIAAGGASTLAALACLVGLVVVRRLTPVPVATPAPLGAAG